MTTRIVHGSTSLARRFSPVLLFVACTSSPLPSEPAFESCVAPGYTPLDDFMLQPPRKLDLAFVVDDSPSIGPKRDKLISQLPKLLAALQDPNDGSLPSLRIAILDGDLGSGGAIASGACGGNNGSLLGDAGALRMIGGLDCGMTDPAASWVQTVTLVPANYAGDINQVFSCLAGELGQSGCGYQQPLQALALSAGTPGSASLREFVREDAYLGLVIISDQDDCSASPNVGMFAPDLPTETAGLRCATRGHACGGQDLPYPTEASYTHPFSDCAARRDPCPAATDTSQPTICTPLADIHALAAQVKALKRDPDNQIFVAGIFGWPLTDADMASSEYKIAPIPNPAYTPDSQAPPTLYDLWPICYEQDHPPSNRDPATGYDAVAAGFGAKPGLRLSAFIDEFGQNGLRYSLCEPDWSNAMMVIGDTVELKLQNLCIDQKLVDADPSTPALDPDCIVEYLEPKVEDAPPPSCTACTSGLVCPRIPGSDAEWTKTFFPRCDGAPPRASLLGDPARHVQVSSQRPVAAGLPDSRTLHAGRHPGARSVPHVSRRQSRRGFAAPLPAARGRCEIDVLAVPDHAPEIRDGRGEALFQGHFRFPATEQLLRPGDVRIPARGIVLGQGLVDDFRTRAGHPPDQRGQL